MSCVLISVLLGGCATTKSANTKWIFDPSPYRPDSANYGLFKNLDEASHTLQTLSDGYAEQRDSLMQQQLLFDIPMMGVAAATIASGIYGGSKGLTLGLGLGTSALAGGRFYFGPQTKVVAYNTAALSLSCASSVANEMSSIQKSNQQRAGSISQDLSDNIALAEGTIHICRKLTTNDLTNLLAALYQANKAYNEILNSLTLLETAPIQLKTFATSVINGATNKIVTGTQNVEATLARINATPTTITPSKTAGAGAGAMGISAAALTSKNAQMESCTADIADAIRKLQDLSAQASKITKEITDRWAVLSTCNPSSS